MFNTITKYQKLIRIISVILCISGIAYNHYTNRAPSAIHVIMSVFIYAFTYFMPIFICWGNQLNLALYNKKRSKILEGFLVFTFMITLFGTIRSIVGLCLGDHSASIALAGATGLLGGTSWCIYKIASGEQGAAPNLRHR